MKRYVITDMSGVIDTRILIPHLECYIEHSGKLYAEQISGHMLDLGKIVAAVDSLDDLDDDTYNKWV